MSRPAPHPSEQQPTPPPQLPRRWTEPGPVIVAGITLFVVAAVLSMLVDGWGGAVATCWAGAAVGSVGYVLFMLQRRSARRGDRGAQRGLV